MKKNKKNDLIPSKVKSFVKAILVVFILFMVIFLVAFFTFEIKDVGKLESMNGYFQTLLGGAIVSLVSVILVYITLQDGNEAKKMENQLKLREMFATEKRWWIHEQLYIYPEKDKKILREDYAKKFNTNNTNHESENEFDLALYDYMGLFEVCTYLIKEGQLEREVFFDSYSYRLHCLTKSKAVEEELNGSPEYWWKLRELINQNKSWRREHGLSNL